MYGNGITYVPVCSIKKKLVSEILLLSKVTHKINDFEILLIQKKLYTFK